MASSRTSPRGPGRVLVVDDDRRAASALAEWLCRTGWHARAAGSRGEAERLVGRWSCDVCVIDGGLPDAPALLAALARALPAAATLVIRTATGPDATESGADAVVGPLPADADLEAGISAAREAARLRGKTHAAPTATPLGRDPVFRQAFETALRIAATDATVLVTGESGTGKSLLARAIHAASRRAARPLVEVSCGSLADGLLDSELFGHVAGAFTGAVADRPGRFVEADGGTIFLDEIATASPALQVRLLRVLQERRLEPVGSGRTRTVDTRVILATHEDLEALVAAGRFRADLFWRVNVVSIDLPPLRARPDDVAVLADHFRTAAAARAGRESLGFTAAALAALARYPWPGNVRELEHAVQRAVFLGRSPLIDVADLPPAIAAAGGGQRPGALREALFDPERRLILEALERHGWRRDAAARHLGINRTALYKKLKRLGMDPRSLPPPGSPAAGSGSHPGASSAARSAASRSR